MQEEKSGRRLFYRLVIVAVEALFGVTACGTTISRSRRQSLEALRGNARDRPWPCDDLLTLLFVTDENARAICASVDSHYSAAKPGLPFRVVLVAERAGPKAAVTAAYEQLRGAHPSLLLFLKEELAQQARVAPAPRHRAVPAHLPYLECAPHRLLHSWSALVQRSCTLRAPSHSCQLMETHTMPVHA